MSVPPSSTESGKSPSTNLVQELVNRLADALQPEDLRHGHVRISDVPAVRRDLVRGQVVLRAWTANAWPPVPGGVDDVEVIGNLRHEVVDIGVPVAVIGRGEEQ